MFFRKNEKLELMQTTLERLETSQKNTELLIDMLNKSIVPKESSNNTFNTLLVNASNQQVEVTEEEKLNAAKALNLCTVSVCQIVDYNDLYIMEQEYEAILNNLNLENMPKDEALLNILKQILDTISFFRIQEGDKKMIEKEYQHKMKNAIWSAVPNFGMIISVGNPVTMLFSLATQVGIGYMNYRKTKAQNDLDHEKNMWNLQKSAMEQLHGLQRELLDTAWRLADKYSFPDEYRLTHKQILQYNDILMDTDYLRRYERLDSIKENFEAYAPFWYYFGNAANHIYQNYNDESIKNKFKLKAIEHFDKFYEINKTNLLREDNLCASYALEYIDLLDDKKDKDKIKYLIDFAVKNGKESWDVLQLCAMSYLKINEIKKASYLLKKLVNEDYNKILNAQILSRIYVSQYLEQRKNDYSEYKLLETRINTKHLFPLPQSEDENIEHLNNTFNYRQYGILLKKYEKFLFEYIQKQTIIFNRNLWKYFESEEDYMFYDTEDIIQKRNNKLNDLIQSKEFESFIYNNVYIYNTHRHVVELANNVFKDFVDLVAFTNQENLKCSLYGDLKLFVNAYNELEKNYKRESSKEKMIELINDIYSYKFKDIFDDFFYKVSEDVIRELKTFQNIRDFCLFERKLIELSYKNNIKFDEDGEESVVYENKKAFDFYELSSKEIEDLRKNQSKKKEIGIKLLSKRNYIKNLLNDDSSINIYIREESEFKNYFGNKENIRKDVIDDAVLVLDKTGFIFYDNTDYIFTLESVIILKDNSIDRSVSYNSSGIQSLESCIIEIIKEFFVETKKSVDFKGLEKIRSEIKNLY